MLQSVLNVIFTAIVLLAATTSAQTACNNSPLLCNRNYNNITHLGAHDSPFVRDASTNYSIAGDQFYDSITQLDAGVRLLTAQVHKVTNNFGGTEWELCHTLCQLLDAGPLSNWLVSIKAWLDRNPEAVITLLLVNSDNADAPTLDGLFSTAGIKPYVYTPPETTQATASWPTLSQLIANNTRLITFIASLDPTTNTVAPYLLNQYTFIFENNYDVVNPADFSCDANRPPSLIGNTAGALSSGYMPLINHFLYDNLSGIEFPSIENVMNTNAPSGSVGNLGDAAKNCTSIYGKAPTFIIVDFFNVGPALDTVDRLNGVRGHTEGRKALPTTVPQSMSASSTSVVSSSTTVVAPLATSSTSVAVPLATSSTSVAAPLATSSTPVVAPLATSSTAVGTPLATPARSVVPSLVIPSTSVVASPVALPTRSSAVVMTSPAAASTAQSSVVSSTSAVSAVMYTPGSNAASMAGVHAQSAFQWSLLATTVGLVRYALH